MSALAGRGPHLAAQVAARTAEIVQRLGDLDESALLAPSELEGWSRLTIACHLRYGAAALSRMTIESLAGKPTSYYPAGRATQRPKTLAPRWGESPSDVVTSLGVQGEQLHRAWSSLTDQDWRRDVTEPDGHADLGRLQLVHLSLLRLTEVEAHGSDLGLGLDRWSDLFLEVALPFRIEWLNRRRTNHRAFDDELHGSWLLVGTGGPTYLVSVAGSSVSAGPASPTSPADAVITGSSRDLLALLLGRPAQGNVTYAGDVALGHAFGSAFPGP